MARRDQIGEHLRKSTTPRGTTSCCFVPFPAETVEATTPPLEVPSIVLLEVRLRSPPRRLPPPFHPSRSGRTPDPFPPKMFRPQPFPLKGPAFDSAVQDLKYTAYHNFKTLSYLAEEMRPRKWRDELGATQKRSVSFITTPDDWAQSGAQEDLAAAVEVAPALSLALTFRERTLAYVSVAAYNGRAAIFSVAPLAAASSWFRRWEVLPPDLRSWLESDAIFILVAGTAALETPDTDGMNLRRVVDTEALFHLYQHTGVIHPHFRASVGDLAWQMTYATGYHHLPTNHHKFSRLVGEHSFGPNWPEWREPSWVPKSENKLDPHEEFFLYYQAVGPQLFVNRLLLHGLIYGAMRAVDGSLPLKPLFSLFLEGGEPKDTAVRDPLGIRSDWPAAYQYHHNPALDRGDQEGSPSSTASSQQTVIQAPSATATSADMVEATPHEEAGAAPAEEETEMEHDGEQQQQKQAPQQEGPAHGEESAKAGAGDQEGDGMTLDLSDNALVEELNSEVAVLSERRPYRLAQKAHGAEGPQEAAQGSPADEKPPLSLFSPLTGANALPVAAKPPPPNPLRGRLGLASLPFAPRPSPLAGRLGPPNVAAGGLPSRPRYGPEDVRARLFPQFADAASFVEGADVVGPPVVSATDDNVMLSRTIERKGGVKERRMKEQHMPFATVEEDLDDEEEEPISKHRVYNSSLSKLEKAKNPYALNPTFHERCTFCSSKHCSRLVAGTDQPNCKKYPRRVFVSECDLWRAKQNQNYRVVRTPE